MYNLDDKGNVNIEDLRLSSSLCIAISNHEPRRDVDWITPQPYPANLKSNAEAIAAHGQCCGDVLTPAKSCEFCKRGGGVFRSCVVLSYHFTFAYLQGRGCMNCYFTNRSRCRCSLCKTSYLYLYAYYSNHIPGLGAKSNATGFCDPSTQLEGQPVSFTSLI